MINMGLRKIIILIYLVLDLNYHLCNSNYLFGFNGVNRNWFSGVKNPEFIYDLSCNNNSEESILNRAINSRMLNEEKEKLRFKKRTPPSSNINDDDYEFSAQKKHNSKRNNNLRGLRQSRYSHDCNTDTRGRRPHRNKNKFRLNRKRKHIFNNFKKFNDSINTNELPTLYKNENNNAKLNINNNNNQLHHAQILVEPCKEVNTNWDSSIISDCFNNRRQVTSPFTHGVINANVIPALSSSVVNSELNTSNIDSKCKNKTLPREDFDIFQLLAQWYKSNNLRNRHCAWQKNEKPAMFGYTTSPMSLKKIVNFTNDYQLFHQKYMQSLLSDKICLNESRSPYNTSYLLPNEDSKYRNDEFSRFIDERRIFDTQKIHSPYHDDSAFIEPVLSLEETSSYPKNFTLVLALVPYPDTSTVAVSCRYSTTTMEPLKYLYAGRSTKKLKCATTGSNFKRHETSPAITIIIPATLISTVKLPETTPSPASTTSKPTPGTVTPAVSTLTPCQTKASSTCKTIILHGELIAAAPNSNMLCKAADLIYDKNNDDEEFMPIAPLVTKAHKTICYDQQDCDPCLATTNPCTKYVYGGELDEKIATYII